MLCTLNMHLLTYLLTLVINAIGQIAFSQKLKLGTKVGLVLSMAYVVNQP